jgi:hypothetical protein
VGHVWTRTLPDVADDLRDAEGQGGAETRRDDAMATVDRPPLTSHEEHARKQHDEERLALQGDEPQGVLNPVVAVGVTVEQLVDVEVDADSLGNPSPEFR